MGRYYNTNSGREGKFMFGVQPSDDAGHMGMHEQEPTSITYYADEDDVEKIKRRLDRQYDYLGVPQEDRLYYCKDDKEMMDYEDKVLHDKVFETVEDTPETRKRFSRETPWASDKEGYLDFEIGQGRCLALARIRLALVILSDIKEHGYCELDAEL